MAKIVRKVKGESNATVKSIEKKEGKDLIKFDMGDLNAIIRNRRSIFPKEYSGEIATKEEIEQLLENAHWAPNHGKTEPWHFIVFEGEGMARLGEFHSDVYKEHTPEELFQEKNINKLRHRHGKCSHIIAICMKRGGNPKIPEIEEIEAVACAVQNMHLTATALGLGAFWSSGGMTYHEEMKNFLELGPEDKCLGFFFIGKPAVDWPEGKRIADWQSKVRWIDS